MTKKQPARCQRLGMAGYVPILAALRDQPMTLHEIIDRGVLRKTTAYRLVTQLHNLGRLHICATRKQYRQPPRPVYAYGPGTSVMVNTPKGDWSSEVVAFAKLLRVLEHPANADDVIYETGLGPVVVRKVIRALREHKLVHVAAWDARNSKAGGALVPSFVLGSGRDARRPPNQSTTERNKKHWIVRKARLRFERMQAALCANASVFNMAQSA